MAIPHIIAARFGMVLKSIFVAVLVPLLVADARATDWRVSGIYAYEAKYWEPWVGKQFPLVVFRYHTGQAVRPQVEAIRELVQSGNQVIVDFEFMGSVQQRKSLETLPAFDTIKSKLLVMLDGLEDIRVEAISLDEENTLSGAKIEYLNKLYRVAKHHSPNHMFVQWPVFRKTGGKIQFEGIDSLETDGWIIDPYLSSEKDYSLIVDTLKRSAMPIYSIIWTAPGWNTGAGYRIPAKSNWWNGTEWKIFYNRLSVNQANNVSSIFYLYALDDIRGVTNLWLGNICDRRFFDDLVNVTLPYYRAHKIPLAPPTSRPEWIPTYCEEP